MQEFDNVFKLAFNFKLKNLIISQMQLSAKNDRCLEVLSQLKAHLGYISIKLHRTVNVNIAALQKVAFLQKIASCVCNQCIKDKGYANVNIMSKILR